MLKKIKKRIRKYEKNFFICHIKNIKNKIKKEDFNEETKTN